MVWDIIWMIVIGLVAGTVAKWVVPGGADFGWIGTAVLGILGSYAGGTLGSLVFSPHHFSIHPPLKHAWIGAIIGAIILLWIYNAVVRKR